MRRLGPFAVRDRDRARRSTRGAEVSASGLPWRDRVAIARHEIAAAAVIVSDVLECRAAQPPDFERLALSLARLRALMEDRP